MSHRVPLLLLLSLSLLLAGCIGQGVTINWETASEVNTAGFNIYRSESPDGPWEKINKELIPPSEDPVRGGKYQFEDTHAEPGKTYYYQLEEVELTGKTTRFDPIQLESKRPLPAWPWWIAGAVVAIVAGWLLGSILPKKGS